MKDSRVPKPQKVRNCEAWKDSEVLRVFAKTRFPSGIALLEIPEFGIVKLYSGRGAECSVT